MLKIQLYATPNVNKNLNKAYMKSILEFNTPISFPLYIESEFITDRDAYNELLIRKGYAYDPDAPVASDKTIEKNLDAIEAKAKADFVKRGRKSKKENA